MKEARGREWAEAQAKCRLSDEAIAMAKELGMGPRSLIKNIPSRSQSWKAPVEQWARDLHAHKFGRPPRLGMPQQVALPSRPNPAAEAPVPVQSPEPLAPAPDPVETGPAVNEYRLAQDELLRRMETEEFDPDSLAEEERRLEFEVPMSQGEIDEENELMLRRRSAFRRVAEIFAGLAGRLDFVEKVALFGSVAAPPRKEVPRFARFRRARVAIWHECMDVDLAVWVTDLTRLRELRRAVSDATNQWQTLTLTHPNPGVAHHQVDVFLMEPGTNRYRGNLCHFGQCPKGKPPCEVTGCGAQPFLQLYADFKFNRLAPLTPPAVVLFERPAPAVPIDDPMPF